MDSTKNLTPLVTSLLQAGIDHYDFKRIVFNGRLKPWLEVVCYEDIKRIIYLTRKNSIALYTFMPFCYKFLGINIYTHYREELKSKWSNCNLCDSIAYTFNNFPNSTMHKADVIDQVNRHNGDVRQLFKIRKKLIGQGAEPVNFLLTINGEKFFPWKK